VNTQGAGFRLLSYLDIPGGGQVVVEDGFAYIGHMEPPHGTTIVDVRNPKDLRVVSQLSVPANIHSHKVRVTGDVMLVNYERFPENDDSHERPVGVKIFDIADRSRPHEIAFFRTRGRGVHRFDVQGTHVFLSTVWENFQRNIMLILDISTPAKPGVVGHWALPGQLPGAPPPPQAYWVHLALARGDRAYLACGREGAVIVDIADPRHPRTVGATAWNPPYDPPTHTFLPVPHLIRNRRFAVVTDEDVEDDIVEDPPAFMWILDITNESRPVTVATYQAEPEDFMVPGKRFGAHQPWEHIRDDNVVFVTWFSGGLRAVDISNPYQPREIARYVPADASRNFVPQSNDVFVDDRGIVYLIDRYRGLSVLEFTR
jgi:hypothetical protein